EPSARNTRLSGGAEAWLEGESVMLENESESGFHGAVHMAARRRGLSRCERSGVLQAKSSRVRSMTTPTDLAKRSAAGFSTVTRTFEMRASDRQSRAISSAS